MTDNIRHFESMDIYDANDMDYIVSIESNQAEVVASILCGEFKPKSVIDIGCGPGNYLLPFVEDGIEVFGIDGSEYAGQCIPDAFKRVDLRFPWKPDKRYDIALCIEVAEHLHAEYADTLIETVAGCSDIVFFTAAIPGQGGKFHHNEQTHCYWQGKFAREGMKLHSYNRELRYLLRNSGQCLSWLVGNSMLFERR